MKYSIKTGTDFLFYFGFNSFLFHDEMIWWTFVVYSSLIEFDDNNGFIFKKDEDNKIVDSFSFVFISKTGYFIIWYILLLFRWTCVWWTLFAIRNNSTCICIIIDTIRCITICTKFFCFLKYYTRGDTLTYLFFIKLNYFISLSLYNFSSAI